MLQYDVRDEANGPLITRDGQEGPLQPSHVASEVPFLMQLDHAFCTTPMLIKCVSAIMMEHLLHNGVWAIFLGLAMSNA